MNPLQHAILNILDTIELKKLKASSARLSEIYKKGGTLTHNEEILAYLIVRLPATYAVLARVLAQVPPGSLLDLGAGPGTAWWAAKAAWEIQPSITAIEREAKFIELGKKMGTEASWIQENFLTTNSFTPHDWVLFSYSLAELEARELPSLLNKSWAAAKKGMVIVEPGTPSGYQRMLCVRDRLLDLCGNLFAPCPHASTCPLGASDWCHFSVRLERSFFHRYAKLAALPFEDEKYTYLIVTKENLSQNLARILRSPSQHSGHVVLPLCSPAGLQKVTISRRQKNLYKKARKAEWGDSWIT
jgi:ribosomal protein RSM22 (predicted rRNA methylase)